MGKKKHRGKAVDKILQESQEKNPTDVLGSWTGVPWNPEEAPVQDADDLQTVGKVAIPDDMRAAGALQIAGTDVRRPALVLV